MFAYPSVKLVRFVSPDFACTSTTEGSTPVFTQADTRFRTGINLFAGCPSNIGHWLRGSCAAWRPDTLRRRLVEVLGLYCMRVENVDFGAGTIFTSDSKRRSPAAG